jgi:hypothetical protein
MQLPVHRTTERGLRRRSCSNGSVISICSRHLRGGGLDLLNRVEPSDPADPAKHTEKRVDKGQQTWPPDMQATRANILVGRQGETGIQDQGQDQTRSGRERLNQTPRKGRQRSM